jgi:hypothetical protein
LPLEPVVKAPSPLLGFNNNVRHKGRVFHIQTEDSGIRHPHIITHLFADGGRILKTHKTSYAEHIGNDRLPETVRAMMQDQHKAMFIALRDGGFDYLFEEGGATSPKPGSHDGLSAPKTPPADSPPVLAAAPQAVVPMAIEPARAPPVIVAAQAPLATPATVLEDAREHAASILEEARERAAHILDDARARAPTVAATRVVAPVVIAPAADVSPMMGPPSPSRAVAPPAKLPSRPPRPEVPRPVAHFAPTEPAQQIAVSPPAPDLAEPRLAEGDSGSGAPASRRRGASRPTLDVDPSAIHGHGSSDSSIDLDLDALERAAAEAQTPFFQQIQDLPPPPAAVLGSKRASTGGYSVRSPAPSPISPHALGREAGSRSQTPGLRPPAPPIVASSSGRYAPSRPASIFATTRPQEGASIFGEDLISEKSLDEVILSYLAEDLDGPAEKK